jgi:hypothetical protein
MSIPGAITELNKEIDRLNKEVDRLTKMRDSLSQGLGQPAVAQPAVTPTGTRQKRKYVRAVKTAAKTPAKAAVPAKKSIVAKKSSVVKSAPVNTAAPVKKREISAATRKKMSDAAKARAATKAEAAK